MGIVIGGESKLKEFGNMQAFSLILIAITALFLAGCGDKDGSHNCDYGVLC